PFFAEGRCKQPLNIHRRRGCGEADAHSCPVRLFDQTRDPGAQSGGVAAEKLSVVACLDAMNAWNKPAQPEFLSRCQSKRIDVARNTTDATRDCEQLRVKVRVPIPFEPELKKRLVESLPMELLRSEER